MRHTIPFRGHPNVRSLHAMTIEITTDGDLTPRGDCIIGVGAATGCGGLPEDIKNALRRDGARVRITLSVDGHTFEVEGRGDRRLELSHPGDIVVRKSSYVCPRTMAIGCNAASDDIPREMVRSLRDPGAAGLMSICVE